MSNDSTISIRIQDDDYDRLKEIAYNQERRFDDLVQLLFAQGLDCYFCDEIVWVSKKPEDYTKEEKAQLETNKAIQARPDYGPMSYKEMQELGFKHVSDRISNHNPNEEITDPLINPMAKRIKNYALL